MSQARWVKARPDYPVYVAPAPFDTYRVCGPSEWQLTLTPAGILNSAYYCQPPDEVGVYGTGYNLSPLNMGLNLIDRNNLYNGTGFPAVDYGSQVQLAINHTATFLEVAAHCLRVACSGLQWPAALCVHVRRLQRSKAGPRRRCACAHPRC